MQAWKPFCEKLIRKRPDLGRLKVEPNNLRVVHHDNTHIALGHGQREISMRLVFNMPQWKEEDGQKAYDELELRIGPLSTEQKFCNHIPNSRGRFVIKLVWKIDTSGLDDEVAMNWYLRHYAVFHDYYKNELFKGDYLDH